MELATGWVTDPDAARSSEVVLGRAACWTVLLATLGVMLSPAVIGIFVLLGILS